MLASMDGELVNVAADVVNLWPFGNIFDFGAMHRNGQGEGTWGEKLGHKDGKKAG